MAIVSSPSLQLQTGLAGTLSESLHTAVVNEAATIVDAVSYTHLDVYKRQVLHQETVLPWVSVMVTMVLLKVLWM